MNLPRSYPHVRVTRYEPPRSYHHMSNTIHEPTRSWHNISRSKCRSIAQSTHQTTKGQQHFRLARPHIPPGETVPDRLAVSTHRQAPASSPRHCSLITAWRSTPCRQAPLKAQLSHTKAIAWRYSVDRQAPYQKHSAAGLGTLTDRFRTRMISQTSLFTFIITLCKITQPYANQLSSFSRLFYLSLATPYL